jgi:hypothetical protein
LTVVAGGEWKSGVSEHSVFHVHTSFIQRSWKHSLDILSLNIVKINQISPLIPMTSVERDWKRAGGPSYKEKGPQIQLHPVSTPF